MSNEQKTAIQQAEKQLEQERKEKLKNEVYQYLKQELESIDSIESKIRKLSEEKRAHEENIKNVKQGNLKAIEERRQAYAWVYTPSTIDWGTITSGSGMTLSASSNVFYSNAVAGTTITTTSGNTYIF